MKRFPLLVSLFVALTLLAAACAPQATQAPVVEQAPEPTATPEPMPEPEMEEEVMEEEAMEVADIVDTAVADGRFTTVVFASRLTITVQQSNMSSRCRRAG